MKKRIALDQHIALLILDIISCVEIPLNNNIQGLTIKYANHSIVLSCLATKFHHNLCEHLRYPIDWLLGPFVNS